MRTQITTTHPRDRVAPDTRRIYDAGSDLLLVAWGLFNRHDGRLPREIEIEFARVARAMHEALDATDGANSVPHDALARIENGGAR